MSSWPEHALAPAVTLQLARAYIELKRYDDALPLLTTFATKYPSSKLAPDAQYLLGWVRVTTGDQRGGMAELRAFLAANPNHEQAPAARRLMAQALGKYGDREDLVAAYKALMRAESADRRVALSTRGRSRAVSGNRRTRRKPGRGFAPSFPSTRWPGRSRSSAPMRRSSRRTTRTR